MTIDWKHVSDSLSRFNDLHERRATWVLTLEWRVNTPCTWAVLEPSATKSDSHCRKRVHNDTQLSRTSTGVSILTYCTGNWVLCRNTYMLYVWYHGNTVETHQTRWKWIRLPSGISQDLINDHRLTYTYVQADPETAALTIQVRCLFVTR